MPKNAADIAPVIPWLDNVLTLAFVSLCAGSVFAVRDDPTHAALLVGLTAATSVVVWLTKKTFAVIGRAIDKNNKLEKAVNMKKFCDQSWQLVIHASMTVWEVYIIMDEDWWSDTTTVWSPHPHNMKTSLRMLYFTQIAIWAYTGISHRFLEARHKDYFVMYLHHVVTVGLLVGSYASGYARVGILVLVLHDSSDIIADLLKMSNYLAFEGPSGLFCTEMLFILNLFTWFWSRCYVFPGKVIWSCAVESHEMIKGDETTRHVLTVGLGLLCCMHVYWFTLFLQLLYRLVKGENAHDVGTEYEGVSDDDKGKKKHR